MVDFTTITDLPDSPNRNASPDDFIEKADEFVNALPQFANQVNAVAMEINVLINALVDAQGMGVNFGPAETAASILMKLLTVDADNAGINATTLQGMTPADFADASSAATFNENGNVLTADHNPGSSYGDVLSVTITPSANDKKIRFEFSIFALASSSTTATDFQLLRGNTVLTGEASIAFASADGGNEPVLGWIIDEPASAAEQTYKLQAKSSISSVRIEKGTSLHVRELS